MKRRINFLSSFSKEVETLLRKRRLLEEDLEAFKKRLVEYPVEGDLIPGAGGVRKIRLKSAAKGKSGGFRVCYFYDNENDELFLMWVYAKNEQENLSAEEKKALKELAGTFKRGR